MIGRIAGRLDYKAEDHVLIDVRGVGYLIYCSDRTMRALPRPGAAVALYTDLLVREDLLQLYGFTTLVEKEWYRLLTGVQGVGAKAALAILGALGPEGVGRAIALGDWNAVKAARGVGPKTAQRVVNELKDKAPTVMAMGAGPSLPDPTDTGDAVLEDAPAPMAPMAAPRAPDGGGDARAEAMSALANLGYAPGEAAGAVAQAADDVPGAETASLIRAALKLLAPKG